MPEGHAYRLALRALDNGDLQTAEQIQQRLVDHPQYGVLATAIQANVLAQRGEGEAALQAAEAISRVPVMRDEAYLIAGRVFHGQGNWTRAIGAYRSAVESHPDNVRAHRWLGVIYHDAGAMRLAVEHLRKVAALDPNDFRALRLAGLIHYDYQNFEEAIADYRAVLQRDPPASMEREVRVELADSLRELRRIDEALKVLASCKATAAVLTARAACWEAKGELATAEAAAEQAVEAAPEDAKPLFVLGRILLLQRQFEAAIKILQRAVEVAPSDHEPRFLLGRALLQSGRKEEGQTQLARSEALKQIFLKMAELHLDAIAQPQDAGVRLQLAELAEQLGRPAIARSWYQAALGLDPASEAAQAALERLR
jgi:tetratricopeptide (TPR) repeat protein